MFLKYKNFLSENIINQDDYVNLICYGNPTKENVESANKESHIKNWFISNGFVEEIVKTAPANDSEITRKDLEILLKKMDSVISEDLVFGRFVDENLAQAFIDFLDANGFKETMGEFFSIDSQVEPLLFYLKDIINRPRPNQLGHYYKMKLYPLIHTDACSASYPSGHALTGFVMGEYYARKYPNIANAMRSFGEKIADSREKMGLHYPSDTELSRKIAKIIWDNNLLMIKYK